MALDSKSSYYDAGGIEVFEVIQAKLTEEQFKGYLLGNVMKYSLRMMHKTPDSPKRDAEKAMIYLSQLLYELDEGPFVEEIKVETSSSL